MMVRRVRDNRRRQHEYVTAHKRRIRDEVRPQLQKTKADWFEACKKNKRAIAKKWHEQKTRVRLAQKDVQRRHKATVAAHKRRIMTEVAGRR